MPFLLALAVLAATRDVVVPIEYRAPEGKKAAAVGSLPEGARPFSLTILDERPEGKDALGTKTRGDDVVVVKTSTDVTDFAREGLVEALTSAGARIEDGGWKLEGRLHRCDVEEAWGFEARVRVSFTLADASGGVVWEKALTGYAKRGSVLPNGTQYGEILSEATQDLAKRLIADQDFRTAIRGEVAAAPPPKPVAAPKAAPPAPPAAGDPDAVLADLVRMKEAGLSRDTMLRWLEQQKLSRKLTADDLIRWKEAGLDEALIQLALSR